MPKYHQEKKESKSDIHFQCNQMEKKEIKMFFAALGETMSEGFLKSMRERRERIKEERPNTKTRKTLSSTKKGQHVTEYKSVDEMFENWGI